MNPTGIQHAVRDILANDETLRAAGIAALSMDAMSFASAPAARASSSVMPSPSDLIMSATESLLSP